MKLLIATNNAGKTREIKSIFSELYDEIVSLKDEGLHIDVVEDGDSFAANARKKAVEISLIASCDVLADDSGLCVDGLDGAPGIYSARFSGTGTDEGNRTALIEAVSNIPEEKRTARFHCAMCVANGGKVLFEAERTSDTGTIITEERGENGFGYDPVFYLGEYGKTYAEIDPALKNSISHRARALEAVRTWLKDR